MLGRPAIEHLTVLCQRKNGNLYTLPLEAGSAESVMLGRDVEPMRPGPYGQVCRRGERAVATFHSHPAGVMIERFTTVDAKLGKEEENVTRSAAYPSPDDFEHSVASNASNMCIIDVPTRVLSCYDSRPLLALRKEKGYRAMSRYVNRVGRGSMGWSKYLQGSRVCRLKVEKR